ncbi:hypothetical protein DX885_000849 [Vibrio mimicus]
MSDCVVVYNGYLMLASQGVECHYVMLTPSELDGFKNTSLGSVTIDPDIYYHVSGYLLLSFLAGHVLGRLLKTLGRG